ncbi:MAG TPA: sugar transferase [Candidatus Paceibacterota bacterium]
MVTHVLMRSNHTIPVINRKEPLILGLGDLILMAFSLWAALVLRYAELPSANLVNAHILPFSIIFILSLVGFYITGLYGRGIHASRAGLPSLIIRGQIGNGILAVVLLYFIPTFIVTPRINLFIYLGLSTVFIILWRLNTYSLLSLRRKSPAFVIGSSVEAEELVREMSHNPRVGLYCRERLSPSESMQKLFSAMDEIHNEFIYVIADMDDPHMEAVLPELYDRYFAKARIIDLHELYEEVFDRIPLSRMNHAWIMSTISSITPGVYDFLKRAFDFLLGCIVGIACVIAYPFVALAIKLEDRGPIFIVQERVGRNGEIIRIHKFRSMQRNDSDKWVSESGTNNNQVTKVGTFIRSARIDELPQALAVIRGDMSLIGPRADVIGLAKRLREEIPYYQVRTIISPGLTGWAQVSQDKPPQSVEETKLRLSYDLYYITHRSFGLDIMIALKTLRTLLSRLGA